MKKKIQKNWQKISVVLAILTGTLILINSRGIDLKVNPECPSSEELVDMFKSEIRENNLMLQPYTPNRGGSSSWRIEANLPQIGYSNKTGFDGWYLDQSKIQELVNKYNKQVEPKLGKIGFEQNQLNTYTKNWTNQIKIINYGYTKNDLLLQVEFSIDNDYYPQDRIRIEAYCGKRNNEEEALYYDLFNSPNVISTIQKKYKTTNLSDTAISIDRVYSNELLGVGMTDLEVFFHKENGKWINVFESQNGPSCQLLERYNIKDSFDCF